MHIKSDELDCIPDVTKVQGKKMDKLTSVYSLYMIHKTKTEAKF